MKKVILSSLLLLPLAMTGCTSSSDATIKNLNAQLDDVQSSVSTSGNYIGESSNYYSDTPSNSNFLRDRAFNDQMEEQYLKNQILSMSSYLKNNQNKKYKLNSQDVQALRTLTNDMKTYTTYLNKSEDDMKNYIKKINKTKTKESNISSSNFQALYNTMNARKAYLNN